MTLQTNNRRTQVPFLRILLALIACLPAARVALAQTGLATVHGRITDASGAIVAGVDVEVKSAETNEGVRGTTDNEGLYTIPALRPGRYELIARKAGFKAATVKQFALNVGEDQLRNITLEVGDLAESITVTGDVEKLNTTDGSVSTVVERQMVENLPLNGRSFQSLLELTPGVNPAVPGPVNGRVNQQGQFTVNGQRADANYFMVDGVSANTGSSLGSALGQSGAGVLPNTTAFGGYNGIVSIDALQEFRVTTSSFAPEYGHTPGGQVSFVTRSGTNSYHGTAFDYFRNTALNANDWFLNSAGQKGADHQNDFGGVFGGPIMRDKLFFFLSYEGLRLDSPQAGAGYTFTPSARTQTLYTVNSLSPFLSGYMAQIVNAYPAPDIDRNGNIRLGNGNIVPAAAPCTSDPETCVARFTGAFPSTAQLDSGSSRIDYALNSRTTLFGRFVHSPSSTLASGSARSINFTETALGSDVITVGLTHIVTSKTTNDLRFNYTNSTLNQAQTAPTFTGSFNSLFPAGFAQPAGVPFRDMQFSFQFLGLVPDLNVAQAPTTDSRQRQFNVVDTLATVKGSHAFKFGVDTRLLDPNLNTLPYSIDAVFYLPAIMEFVTPPGGSGGGGPGGGGPGGSGPGLNGSPPPPSLPCGGNMTPGLPMFLCGQTVYTSIQHSSLQEFRIPNWSFFVQDTWKIRPRLTVTYGARYEVAPAPHSLNGRPFFSLKNFDAVECTRNLAASFTLPPAGTTICQAGVNPLGTSPYPTTWGNIAPRIGIAYQLSHNPAHATVLRTGLGIFYDVAGNASAAAVGPYSRIAYYNGLQLPVTTVNSQNLAPPPFQTDISPAAPYNASANAAAPNLRLPRTYGFNFSLQQALGNQQSATLSYVGAIGSRLIGSVSAFPQNLADNGVRNTYFISPTFAGPASTLTVYGNYSSSNYNALQGQFQRQFYRSLGIIASYTWSHSLDDASNFNAGAAFPRSQNYSSSDFDIRQTFAASMVFDAPTLFKRNRFLRSATSHWSIDPVYHYQTGLPVNVIAESTLDTNILTIQRPSLIPGVPLYVYGADCAAQNGGSPCPGNRGFNSAPVTNLPNTSGLLPHPQCQPSVPTPNGPSVVGYGAFCAPAVTSLSSVTPQGNVGRNILRGFPLRQFDLDVHRDFQVAEHLRLRFVGQIFNVLNQPNFSTPQNSLFLPNFGKSTSMMNSSFGTGSISAGGGNNPLYSLGGPRSVQLALKIIF